MPFTENQVRTHVLQALARCLARKVEEIRWTDTLVADLGLDSLDFIDLMFALEKALQVKIRDADFDRLLKPTQNEALPPQLAPAEVEAMARFIPGLKEKAREQPIARNSVISMMTAESLVQLVLFKLDPKKV